MAPFGGADVDFRRRRDLLNYFFPTDVLEIFVVDKCEVMSQDMEAVSSLLSYVMRFIFHV
jgi:hypothetical protein